MEIGMECERKGTTSFCAKCATFLVKCVRKLFPSKINTVAVVAVVLYDEEDKSR